MDGEEGQPRGLLTFGTLTEAFYRAHARAPENKMVQHTLEKGLTCSVVLNRRTPLHILWWLRGYHNKFHGGSEESFIQLLQKVPLIESQWAIYRDQKQLNARACGSNYEKIYFQWLTSQHPDTFRSYLSFDNAKSYLHAMRRLGVESDFFAWSAINIDFLSPGFDTENTIRALHDVLVAIIGIKGVPAAIHRILALEAMKLCVLALFLSSDTLCATLANLGV